MRLIDADKFKQEISTTIKINLDAIFASIICELIDMQPTAYNAESVIQQLKEESCIIDNAAGNRAVEIIETGGAERRQL